MITKRLETVLSRYGFIEFTVNHDTYGEPEFITTIVTPYREQLRRFADDMEKIAILDEEVNLRKNNPSLQQAYEEYQILLKLSK